MQSLSPLFIYNPFFTIPYPFLFSPPPHHVKTKRLPPVFHRSEGAYDRFLILMDDPRAKKIFRQNSFAGIL